MWSSSKPIARNVSHLPRLAVANTSRPQCRANCTAAIPDATGAGVDQHRLARLDVGQLAQRVVRRGEDHRYAGGLGVATSPRASAATGARRPATSGAGALGEEPHHAVADGELRHAGPDFDDDAGALAADQRVVGEHARG